MAIRMQGAWTVAVRSRSAALPQRFVVEGASSGNGVYAGDVATPPVFVTGGDWTLRIQHNPGPSWADSADQVTWPTTSAGQYRFDIQSNDSGADLDFDDLVLTCSTPVTATDFLVYGHVSSYRGACLFNPCYPGFVVIDSAPSLAAALEHPALRDALGQLYPRRIKPQPPNPPDPEPFVPLIASLLDDAPLPPKHTLSARVKVVEAPTETRGKSATKREEPSFRVTSFESVAAVRPVSRLSIDRVGIAALSDRVRLLCDTQPLAGVALRFQEYDRTAAELAGGPYTGSGQREHLGATVTDRNGNYIFRFSRSIADFLGEAAADTAVGEHVVTQSAPDLIVQLVDAMAPASVLWESAPYFNVPNARRINVCVPDVRLHATRCVAGQVFQSVGNVWIGPAPATQPAGEPPGYGVRTGFGNSLGLEGRITARNASGPQARCAAWHGTLDLFGCFLDHPAVTHFTIRYRRLGGATGWTFLSQELRHPLTSKAGTLGYSGELIGPSLASLRVDGAAPALVPAYLNIESNAQYVSTHRDRRGQVRTGSLAVATPGPVQFWIEGYDANGNKLAGAEDSLTLFIDNTAPSVDIDDTVMMGSTSQGHCAKFKLPAGQPGAPLTVKFMVDQFKGFLGSYALTMGKGAHGAFGIEPPPPAGPPFRARAYEHGDDLACAQLRGTYDDPTHDLASGYVSIDLRPAGGGPWLDPGQTFCAFSIGLSATSRVTDGYSSGRSTNATPVLIGIEA